MLLRPDIPAWARRYGRLAELALLGWGQRRQDGLLALIRPGPVVPPISLPESDMGRMLWAVIITEAIRLPLAATDQRGFTFRPVIKQHIFPMAWEKWVLTAETPSDPIAVEDAMEYFLRQTHSPEVAAQMGTLWEMCLDKHATWTKYKGISHWDGTDWFRVQDFQWDTDYIFVSARAKSWLSQAAPGWATFKEYALVPD